MSEKEIKEKIWEAIKPKFKLCVGNHPSHYTGNWVCVTCAENKGYNEAIGKIKDILDHKNDYL